jgi:hypothetical protein
MKIEGGPLIGLQIGAHATGLCPVHRGFIAMSGRSPRRPMNRKRKVDHPKESRRRQAVNTNCLTRREPGGHNVRQILFN